MPDPKEEGKLFILERFFDVDIWFLEWETPVKVVGCSIKCDGAGRLAILKAVSAEGPKVAFVGGKTFDSIRRTLRSDNSRNNIKWRDDKYKLDRK